MHRGYIRIAATEPDEKKNQLVDATLDVTYCDSMSLKEPCPEMQKMFEETKSGDIIHIQSADRIADERKKLNYFLKKIQGKHAGICFHTENIYITPDMSKEDYRLQCASLRACLNDKCNFIGHSQEKGIQKRGRQSSVTVEQKNEAIQLFRQKPNIPVATVCKETGVPISTCYKLRASVFAEQK